MKTFLKILACIIGNVIIHGLFVIVLAMPIVDHFDGYFSPGLVLGIVVFIQQLVILVSQIDLILLTIHSIMEDVKEEYLPRFYIGLPWNYLFKPFTAGMWS